MKANAKRKGLMAVVAIGILVALVGCGVQPMVAGGGGSQSNVLTGAGAAAADMGYTITVNGTGVASAVPDVADIQLGVEVTHSDAGQAISDNTARMNEVLDAVKALGVDEKDIQTVNYNMWVEQIYDREGVPTDEIRYHVTNQISIRLRDLTQAGKLLEDALEAGANTVNGITFSVAETAALQSDARAKAVANAQAKAEELAASLGVSVGKVRQVSEYTSSPVEMPVARMEGLGGGGGEVPISSGSFNVSVDVQVVFDIAQ